MSDVERKRFHARVEGRVQGVGFRYFVQRSATGYQIRGWVRNRWDRSVEVVAEGETPNLQQLLNNLRAGPPGSNVVQVDVVWEEPTGEFNSFQVRATA